MNKRTTKDFYAGETSDVTEIQDVEDLKISLGASQRYYIVIIYGENIGRRYTLENDTFLMGRSPDCDLSLADDSVSRMHCRINPKADGAVLVDLDSTNGTYINTTAVSARKLNDGDRIKIGRTILKFLSGDNVEHAYHEEIYRLKTTDGLTSAYNKRYFDEEVEREMMRFFRYQRPLSMLMIDIDFFKKVNDEYGHLAGDRVLGQLGFRISSSVRKEDTFCRYGGEEFVLLMPEMDIKGAYKVAERLRRLIKTTSFIFEGLSIPVTISIGAAEANVSMEDAKVFVKEADEQMYAAKKAGRNCVRPDLSNPE